MSLRARILVLVLLASLLPLLPMLWLLLERRAATVDAAREQLLRSVESLADDLDDKIAGTGQLLFGLARVPVVGGEDKKACSDFLAEVLEEHSQYTGLLTILPDGNLHCDSLRSGRALNLNDRAYFRQAKSARGLAVEAAIGRLTGKSVLQIAYPVRAPSRTLGFVMLASLDMDQYGRTVIAAQPYPKMNFQVWNADGSVIMDYPGRESAKLAVGEGERRVILAGTKGRVESVGEGASRRIWATAGLRKTAAAGLHLALAVPESELYAEIDQHYRQAILALLVVALLVFGGGLLLAQYGVRRQTRRLMDAILRVDSGNFREMIGEPYPGGELGSVMRAMDRMSASLEHQRRLIRSSTEALERQANFDALTGLANRNLLTDRIDQALIHGRRAARHTGVLMLDLDRFKTINDSLGHNQGDILLKAVAQRLSAIVREGDTVARLGGDEFVVVLTDLSDIADIVPIAQQILASVAAAIELDHQQVSVCTSLGIAVAPKDGDSTDVLLKHADTAMYRAKGEGGNAMAFFTPDMLQKIVERLNVESGLRQALEQGHLRTYFQPIIEAASGRVVAAEALLRWADPQRGLIPPDQFIPVAEDTGLILPIGDWVLRSACENVVAWHAAGIGPISVAVNLSPRQFKSADLIDSVEAALRAYRCAPAMLEVEITESTIMVNPELALTTMNRLRALGIALSVDDFGTGYSSLGRLRNFPVSKLKIDRAFVQEIRSGTRDENIVDMIVVLARKLGMRTVAEGVETAEQAAFLESLGCDEYQGYLFSKPLPAQEFMAFALARNRR
ncbi:MAG TPA: EAL domain-containing protein [Usitatibacteraceae bacterium]|nr:EAL domain-containing protein [Usitatibacteraceae bacterium]